MMELHVRRMRDYLAKAAEAGGFVADEVVWMPQGRYMAVGGSGVEVALSSERSGSQSWAIREVYDVADLVDGGTRPVIETISMHPVGDEATVARSAALRAVERRIDLALDEAA